MPQLAPRWFVPRLQSIAWLVAAACGAPGGNGDTGSSDPTSSDSTSSTVGVTAMPGSSEGGIESSSGSADATSASSEGPAGSSSGSSEGGSSGAPPVELWLADDFETAAVGDPPDPALWTIVAVGANGTITIDDTVAHGGTQSVHVVHEGFSKFMAAEGIFPAPDNRFFARVWLRLPNGIPQGHVTWIELGLAANDVDEARIGANIGQLDVNHWPGDQEQRADAVLDAGGWHCVEVGFDGPASELRVWLDEVELEDLHVTDWVAPPGADGNNTQPLLDWAPTVESLRFGWELGAGELWFDDVAVGGMRIGCG